MKEKQKTFKGLFLFCAGDTPAAAFLGGFKESVSVYRLCRSCLSTSEQYRNYFYENNFIICNKIIHNHIVHNHIEVTTDPTLTKTARKFWQNHIELQIRILY